MRRFVLRAAAAALAGTCLAGCSTPAGNATKTPDTTPPFQEPEAPIDEFRFDRRLTLYETGTGQAPSAAGEAGRVEHPTHRDLLLRQSATRPTTDPASTSVRLLPEQSTDPRRFAVLAAANAILRKSPVDTPGHRDNLSELTEGEELWLLDRVVPEGPALSPTPGGSDENPTTMPSAAAACWLVHSSDGYVGWVDESALRFVDAPAFADRLRSHTSDTAKARVERAVAHAQSMAGTPYLWGGKTKQGIDCSGLTQTAYAAAGVRLPRDADMQSAAGRLVATRWFRDGLLPGDLLFFVHARRGHVHHVAMYLGDGRYIESGGPGVRVRNLLDKTAADYDAKADASFGWARRVVE